MKKVAKTKSRRQASQPELADLISQADAAKLRGVSRASISELVSRGRLSTVEVAGRPLLLRTEVEGFEPEAGGRGKRAASSKRR